MSESEPGHTTFYVRKTDRIQDFIYSKLKECVKDNKTALRKLDTEIRPGKDPDREIDDFKVIEKILAVYNKE